MNVSLDFARFPFRFPPTNPPFSSLRSLLVRLDRRDAWKKNGAVEPRFGVLAEGLVGRDSERGGTSFIFYPVESKRDGGARRGSDGPSGAERDKEERCGEEEREDEGEKKQSERDRQRSLTPLFIP